MNAIITREEMAAAIDRLLAADRINAALGLDRELFGDQRDPAILDELATDFEFSASASAVLAQAAQAAREIEGYVRKICCRCDREFWIVAYLAPKPAFDRCGRTDCVRASAREAA